MLQFAKTQQEKQEVKQAKADFRNYMKKKYPEDFAAGKSLNEVWKSNLQVNSKFN